MIDKATSNIVSPLSSSVPLVSEQRTSGFPQAGLLVRYYNTALCLFGAILKTDLCLFGDILKQPCV